MSRLDSFIRRMEAQRSCLNRAAALVEGLPGPVLELGLGNGRTYDHLRELLPGRAIHVFERQVACHPDCVPPPGRLFLGEVAETLPRAAAALGRTAALIHTDLGCGDAAANAALASTIAPALAALLAPGGICVANHELSVEGWGPEPPPGDVPPGRYFLYRAG